MKHEARVPSDISHELSPARLPLPLCYHGPFCLSYMAVWKFHLYFLGQHAHFFARWNLVCKEHEKYDFLWALHLPESCTDAYGLQGTCPGSSFSCTIHIVFTRAPVRNQISSECLQTGLGKRHWLHSECSSCQKEQEPLLPMVIKPCWEIKRMPYRIGCLFHFLSLPPPLNPILDRKE